MMMTSFKDISPDKWMKFVQNVGIATALCCFFAAQQWVVSERTAAQQDRLIELLSTQGQTLVKLTTIQEEMAGELRLMRRDVKMEFEAAK